MYFTKVKTYFWWEKNRIYRSGKFHINHRRRTLPFRQNKQFVWKNTTLTAACGGIICVQFSYDQLIGLFLFRVTFRQFGFYCLKITKIKNTSPRVIFCMMILWGRVIRVYMRWEIFYKLKDPYRYTNEFYSLIGSVCL